MPEPLAGRLLVAVRCVALGGAEGERLLAPMPEEAVDALLAVARPGVESMQTIVELRRLGEAFAGEPRHPGALCHRDAPYALITIGLPVPRLAEQVSLQRLQALAERHDPAGVFRTGQVVRSRP